MASKELVSNLKQITSGKAPTTSTLANGEMAFGLVGGVAKLYGNMNGTIVDFSDFLRTAPVTSVAGKTGAVSLTKADVGLSNVDNTADANKTVLQARRWLGSDVRSTNEAPSFYMSGSSMTSRYEFKQVAVIGLSSLFEGTYCYVQTMTPWHDNTGGYPVQIATQSNYEGNVRMAMRCGLSVTTWSAWKRIATDDQIPAVPVVSVNGKTGAVVLVKGDVGLGNVDNVRQYSASNPPPYPVTSVAGRTGAIVLSPIDVGLGNVDNVKQFSASNLPAPSQISGSHFVGADTAKWAINVGTLPTYPGTNTSITWSGTGLGISQGIAESSGIWFDGDGINMWSPCDRDAITYYDEDDGSKVFRVTSAGIVYRKDGKRALYEGEAGGGSPYVTTISSWSGSSGNYYSTISATTHGKGTYPSVHTYVQNGSLWEETYDSPAIDASGNVTIYTNSSISIKVVIK